MKKMAITGTFITCLFLLNVTKVMSQAPGITKTQGNSSTELIVSDQAGDYPGYLSVEPNHANKACVVHCTPHLKNAKIVVCNLSGKVMAKYENVQSGLVTIENKNLPSGVYLLQLKDNDVTVQTRRIVVE